MRILISGGPTWEALDDVRYLGNRSSGRMAIEIAEAALRNGHLPVLVLGPTHLQVPQGVELTRVESATEMLSALIEGFSTADALVMAAAVSDYRPAKRHKGKWKKGPDTLHLELIKNPDILRELGMMARGRPVIGFALEATEPSVALASARDKLRRKGCSLIVLNGPGSLGSDGGEQVVLVSEKNAEVLGQVSKCTVAEHLIRFLEAERGESGDDERKREREPVSPG